MQGVYIKTRAQGHCYVIPDTVLLTHLASHNCSPSRWLLGGSESNSQLCSTRGMDLHGLPYRRAGCMAASGLPFPTVPIDLQTHADCSPAC